MKRGAPVLLAASLLLAPLGCFAATPRGFSGQDALTHAEAVTQFGPRPSGTPAHERTQKYIQAALESWKLKPEVDRFVADTPIGKVSMANIVARIPGRAVAPANQRGSAGGRTPALGAGSAGGSLDDSGGKTDRVVIVAGHYDTKRIPGIRFVGANDGGSSTGLLLELARVLARGPRREREVWIVFLDGEESQAGPWTPVDSLHGSRRMAQKLGASGEAARVQAVLVVDMIGDRQLDLLREQNSTGWLSALVREVAAGLGLEQVFGSDATAIEDDHMPFLGIGLAAADLIDFHYGPNNSYWHTAKDTTDKLSARSLETVGRIVLGTIDALGKRQ